MEEQREMEGGEESEDEVERRTECKGRGSGKM